MSAKPYPQLRVELDAYLQELDNIASSLAAATREEAKAEIAFEREMAKREVALLDRHKRASEKVPSEKTRERMILANEDMDPIWGGYLTAKAEVSALEKLARAKQAVISGIQSQLSLAKVEASL